jgi:hypothetical protein
METAMTEVATKAAARGAARDSFLKLIEDKFNVHN